MFIKATILQFKPQNLPKYFQKYIDPIVLTFTYNCTYTTPARSQLTAMSNIILS